MSESTHGQDICIECGDLYHIEDGCLHGRPYCTSCTHRCRECCADLADQAAAEANTDGRWI